MYVCEEERDPDNMQIISVKGGSLWCHLPLFGSPILSGFPDSSVGKESSYHAGDSDSIPGPGRSPGEGKVYPL